MYSEWEKNFKIKNFSQIPMKTFLCDVFLIVYLICNSFRVSTKRTGIEPISEPKSIKTLESKALGFFFYFHFIGFDRGPATTYLYWKTRPAGNALFHFSFVSDDFSKLDFSNLTAHTLNLTIRIFTITL